MASERWLAVIGFESLYEVSDRGRVRSRTGIMAPSHARKYLYLALWQDGKRHGRAVHRLVLEAFVGLRPAGKWAAHEDGNPENNRLTNLSWKTPAANAQDKNRHGTMLRGTTHPNTKMSARDVKRARALVARGLTHREVGRRLGVAGGHIGNIICGARRA